LLISSSIAFDSCVPASRQSSKALAIAVVSSFCRSSRAPVDYVIASLYPEALDHCPSDPHILSDSGIKFPPLLLNPHNPFAIICIGLSRSLSGSSSPPSPSPRKTRDLAVAATNFRNKSHRFWESGDRYTRRSPK